MVDECGEPFMQNYSSEWKDLAPRDVVARSSDEARTGAQWLEVPHPSASERLFVLAPLADLAPDLEPPGWGMSVAGACARARVAEGPEAVKAIGVWDHATNRWVDTDG